jgi:RNA polymerase sigma factor (sigma-70 family)
MTATLAPTQALAEQRVREYADMSRQIARRAWHEGKWPGALEREDLEQIALIELWEVARKAPADMGTGFGGFATRAIRCELIDVHRKFAGKGNVKENVAFPGEFNPEVHDGPVAERASLETLDQIRRAFTKQSFTERQEQIIALLLQGYTQSEIARELGVTAPAIGHTIRQIARRVAPMLDRTPPPPRS